MTQLEKLKLRIPEESNDNVLVDLLDSSTAVIMRKRYPFEDFPDELETRYLELQLELAVYKYNKLGVEGESAHSENCNNRSYFSESDLLKDVIPKGAVI